MYLYLYVDKYNCDMIHIIKSFISDYYNYHKSCSLSLSFIFFFLFFLPSVSFIVFYVRHKYAFITS